MKVIKGGDELGRSIRKLLLVGLLLIMFQVIPHHVMRAVNRQSCPKIEVRPVSLGGSCDSEIELKAEIDGQSPSSDLTFNWTVKHGEVTQGQGRL